MGTIERLRHEESVLRDGADLVGVPPDDLVQGIERRLGELKSLRDEIAALRKELAGNQAGELADAAVDGVLVAQVDSEDRNALRDLAVALRDRPGMRAVVLGSSPGGKGAALVAPWRPTAA